LKYIIKTIQALFLSPFAGHLLSTLLRNRSDKFWLRVFVPLNTHFKSGSFRLCRRGGINFLLDLSDYQSWLLYFHSSADSSEQVVNYVFTGDSVFDIGGNIGQTALLLAEKVSPSGMVYSFEPYLSTFDWFKTNLFLNPEIQNIKVSNIALGNTVLSTEMHKDCFTNTGSYRIASSLNPKIISSLQVNVSTLDDFILSNDIHKVDFIKIDVEGYELKVLKGAIDSIRRYKPILYIEVNNDNLIKYGDCAQSLFSFIFTLGYQVFEVKSGIEVKTKTDFKANHGDIYCIKNKSYN
jgi:FkbM family methyltransferase